LGDREFVGKDLLFMRRNTFFSERAFVSIAQTSQQKFDDGVPEQAVKESSTLPPFSGGN